MLELELKDIFKNISVICEKINTGELKNTVSKSDLLIFDSDYHSNNLSFLKSIKTPVAVISKHSLIDTPECVKKVFIRPFLTTDLVGFASDFNESAGKANPVEHSYKYTDIQIDCSLHKATVCGKVFHFAPKEFSLFCILYENRGKVVSRRYVLDSVWGKDYNISNNVDNVYVNYLRKKVDYTLGIKLIHTLRGKGYMMK